MFLNVVFCVCKSLRNFFAINAVNTEYIVNGWAVTDFLTVHKFFPR